MIAMEWTLEIGLVVLLGATLFQAIRLERALGVLKRDRASLESLVIGFNASTHQAESGIQRLRSAVDGAGRQIEQQISKSLSLRDDLAFLTERGDRLADRLEIMVRAARPLAQQPMEAVSARGGSGPPAADEERSQAERDLLAALRMAR
jgi:hypothetical protein